MYEILEGSKGEWIKLEPTPKLGEEVDAKTESTGEQVKQVVSEEAGK
ncbi:MAG: hypothetical protein ABII07_03210 [Patescibacteria group bacterium]|nr:hypothetical protein [Patescibacteria group bacterium]